MGPALLCLLGTLAFALGVTGGFVLDDRRALLENPVVAGRVPLGEAFVRTYWGAPLGSIPPSYRPLAVLVFAVERRLFGWSSLGFHTSSLLAYLALLCVGWAFARRCFGAAAALAAMAVFAVMPVHTENVTSLVGRADTLGVLCAVLALWALAPTLVDGLPTRPLRLLGSAVAFLAGVFCKESIAVLPLVVALFAAYRRGQTGFLRLQIPSGVLLATLGAYLGLRAWLQPGMLAYTSPDDVLAGAGLLPKVGYGLELVARYAHLIFVPVGLCTGRKYAEVARPDGVTLIMVAGAALLAVGILVSWRAYRRSGYPFIPAAFAAWFLIAGFIFAMPESMADRFLLLPSFFLCLALGPMLAQFWGLGRLRQGLVLFLLALQVALCNRQALTWRSQGTLLAHAVDACPDSVHNHFRYAEYLSGRGQTAEAVWHYAVASQGVSHFPHPWTHPAKDEEWSWPIGARMHDLHRLMRVKLDAPTWRQRFAAFLRGEGLPKEAALVESLVSIEPSAPAAD